MASKQYALPLTTVTRTDVGRVIHEIEVIDGFLAQAAIRKSGSAVSSMPKTSQTLDDITLLNKLNLLQTDDRNNLHEFLTNLRAQAPILHLSFNNEPSPLFQQKLVNWIRQQIHPSILLQIGLSPSIGAGCLLRTTNKVFDFSLKQRFIDSKEMLISRIKENPSLQPTSKPVTLPATNQAVTENVPKVESVQIS